MGGTPDDIIPLYERYAHQWDEDRPRALIEQDWLDTFLALLPGNASILDLGCGAGDPIARYFLERGCRVTGVDSSPAMIAICQRRLPAAKWLAADMRTLPLDYSFHGIIAWNSFFHLCREDQRQMFAVFARYVLPGGALMFTTGATDGEAIGCLRDQPLYHASLSNSAYRTLLKSHGFDVVRQVNDDPDCYGCTVWLARRGR